jgi:hypothetical protein
MLFLFATATLASNIYLLKQLKEEKLRTALSSLQSGRTVSGIAGLNAKGVFTDERFPQDGVRHFLVFTVSPTCPQCVKNQEQYRLFADALRHRRNWRIRWVSRATLEETARFAATYHIPPEELLSDPPFRTHMSLGMQNVPALIVLNASGLIQGVWRGNQECTLPQILSTAELHERVQLD